MNLLNKKIVITGATSGIGEALAIELSKQNNTLILCARRENVLQDLVLKCKKNGSNAFYEILDLSNETSVAECAKNILEKYNSIDILINNGGVSQRATAIKTPLETDRLFFETNYFGTIAFTKYLLPSLINSKGHIVVISSIAGKFGFYLRSAYSASKFALHGFFESLRLELLTTGVNVTIVCPGKIKTNISYNAIANNGEKHNVLDPSHAKAMTAEKCAQKIVNAINKNKREVFIGGKELLAVYLNRFFPSLFFYIIKNQSQHK